MQIELAYAAEKIKLEIPDHLSVDHYSPVAVDGPVDFATFKEDFLEAAGNSFLSSQKPLLVVNDGHRPTPTPTVLSHLDRIDPGLLGRADIMIAAGTHGEPTDKHYQKIFSDHYRRVKDRVRWHDAHDYSRMKKIGVDRFGGEVWIDRVVFDYERIIAISSAEPHYFAGFTGGRKSILPGLADFASVERNHNLANSLDAAPLRLEGNPVAEHMAEVLEMLDHRHIFGIQTVIDARQNLAGAFFGDLVSAFQNAVAFSEKTYARPVPHRYDTVVCEVLPPIDGSLYQVQKALENCQPAVKDGGRIVLVSACRNGVGSEHFYELAKIWDREANTAADGKLHFGSHKLSRVNLIGRRISVRLFSTLPDDEPRQVFYEPLADLASLFSDKIDKEHKIAVVRDSGNTVLKT
ncbi:MAG: DUF2088 domain-containing protein [Candidatus Zixiibacteriota bacterium]|nr:MAG: DUF2088 domain-containing protein [candidate division Zixibacteria bacterium]